MSNFTANPSDSTAAQCEPMAPLAETIGEDLEVDTLSGSRVKYLNLDNAATTPPLRFVADHIDRFLGTYGSIQRGSGYKSQLSTAIYEAATPIILSFLNAAAGQYSLVPAYNTTSAINRLSRMLRFSKADNIWLSDFEHSSNDLPWRNKSNLHRIPADLSGNLNLDFLEESLRKPKSGRRLIAISGASNVTGALAPIYDIAALADKYGAIVAVDAAQLAPHREIFASGTGVHDAIDFVTFSGHKMYAPYGGGVLVGRKKILDECEPDDIGGGNVAFATHDDYDLSPFLARRMTAGTPNAVGLISIALACTALKVRIGFESIFSREQVLLNRLREKISPIERVHTYSDLGYDAGRKCAVFTFSVSGMHPNLVAARLGHEFGIGVRQGAICQFLHVARLLDLDATDLRRARRAALSNQSEGMFGIVRASFGVENVVADVDRLAEALVEICATSEAGNYYRANAHGEYWPVDLPQRDGLAFYKDIGVLQ